MHFFLQGERGVGKSYLLRQALHPYQEMLAGFAVSRLIEQAAVVGFRVQNVRAGLPPLDLADDGTADNVFLYRGKRDLSVLQRIIRQVEADCQDDGCRLILLDEIGGVELLKPEFMESLTRILSCQKPCVGVFKSAANLQEMMLRQGLPGGYMEKHAELEDRLKRGGELVTMTGVNREQCATHFSSYLNQNPIKIKPHIL